MTVATAIATATGPRERALPIVVAGHVDHGKSTLVGRLLHDTGSLPEGRLQQLAGESTRRNLSSEWSFVLDSLQIERDQGITVDTTQIWFRSDKRRYVIIDAPGHKEFLRNMLTGASQAEAAVLVIDAQQGLSEQTRRHAYLLHLIGIRQLVVAVNKLDLIGYDPARYLVVADGVRAYLQNLGFAAPTILPISARHGENVVARSETLAWHSGPTLIEALDALQFHASPADRPLRLPVQDIYRRGDKRIIVGRVESGTVAVGDTVQVGHGRTAQVVAFEAWNAAEPRTAAKTGESVALVLSDEAFVQRGTILAAPGAATVEASTLLVRLFWLAAEPLRAGARLRLRIATADTEASVPAIERVVDLESAEDRASDEVRTGEIATVVIRLPAPVAVDRFADNPASGRGVLSRGGAVVAGFIVERVVQSGSQRQIVAPKPSIARARRERAHGHRGGVVWLTGLSGAGKSSIAGETAQRLFDLGWEVQILDGDILRSGLNADLGFNAEDRDENIRRAAHVAQLWASGGALVIVAMISPLARHRASARKIVGLEFHEAYVHADVATCRRRDPKGLYRLADEKKIEAFTGVSAPYERPERPDVIIDTTEQDLDKSAALLLGYIKNAFGTLPEEARLAG